MQRSIQPTQVVHVRNAPEDISALDLCILAMKFGTVINTLIMRQKGQVSWGAFPGCKSWGAFLGVQKLGCFSGIAKFGVLFWDAKALLALIG